MLSVQEVETKKALCEADVTLNNGYILDWRSLSNVDKKKVIYERNTQGVKLGYRKGSKTAYDRNNLKELKKKQFKLKSNIKALKKKVTQEKDDQEEYNNGEPEDAGDQF